MILISEPTPVPYGHGGGLVAYKQAKLFADMGILDCIMTTLTPDNPDSKFCTEFGVPVIDIRCESSPMDTRFSRGDPWAVDAVIAHELMHLPNKCHDIFTNGGGMPITTEFARSKGWKIVCDVAAHNAEESAAEKAIHGLDLFKMFPHLDRRNAVLWHRWNMPFHVADLILVPAQMSRDYMSRSLPMSPDTIKVVCKGVDLHKQNELDTTCINALHVSQWGHDKAQLYLVRSWLEFINTLPQIKAHLEVIGFNTNMIPAIYHIAPDAVIKADFRGHVPQEFLEDAYRAANVYLHSSVTEGFGLTITEALGYGIPILTSDGAGASELIKNGVNGFVTKIRDSNAMASNIAYLAQNPAARKAMGNAAYETAKEHPWSRWEKETKAEIEKVL